MEYEFYEIKRSDYKVERSYSAQLKGCQDIKLISKVEGYLKEIYVKDGDRVKKGQVLFVIDQTDFRGSVASAKAGVSQAEALLGKARQDHEGKKILRDKNVISEFELIQSQRDVDVAKSNLEVAKAQLEIASNALSFTEIKSPTDGLVGQINYREGDFVGPNMEKGLTTVSDNHQMDVYFSMSEDDAMSLISTEKSMKNAIEKMPELTLTLPGGNVYPHKGRVESISGVIDDQTGTVAVRVVFPNNEGILLSGGSGRLTMEHIYSNVIVVPQESTYDILDKTYVVKCDNGVAKSLIITVAKQNDGKGYIVTDGLSVGDTIVASGAGLLHDGDVLK